MYNVRRTLYIVGLRVLFTFSFIYLSFISFVRWNIIYLHIWLDSKTFKLYMYASYMRVSNDNKKS